MEDLIQKYLNTKVRLGRHDCLTMLLDYLGISHKPFRYRTLGGATKSVLKQHSYDSADQFYAEHFTEIDPLFVTTGDLLVINGLHHYLVIGDKLFGISDGIFGFLDIRFPLSGKAYRKI